MKALGLQTLPLAKISLGQRLRVVDEDHAAHLAENIAEVGRLRAPIEVRQVKGLGKSLTYAVIAGGHRFRAVQVLGWTEIDAFVFEMTEQEARIWEIDENIRRHELNPLDRAVFLSERQRLYEEMHPETKAGVAGGKARQGSANEIISFATDAAQRCGLKPRTIQMAISIAKNLAPDVRAALPGTALAKKQSELLALAKLGHGEQRQAIGLLLGDAPKARNMAGAIKLIKGVRTTPAGADDGFNKLVAAWGRATSQHEREAFLQWLWLHQKDTTLRDFVAGLDHEEAA